MKTCILRTAITLAVVAGLAFPALADKGKKDDRGYLGVTAVGIEQNLHGEPGVFISEIHVGSGAASAGLQEHDRIVDVDGIAIASMEDLDGVLESRQPGDSVWVRVAREFGEQTMNGTLGDKPEVLVHTGIGDHGRWVVELIGGPARLGIQSQTLNPQLARFFAVESGVLVTEVSENSAAFKAGIEAGDVLLELDGSVVSSTEDIARHLHHNVDGGSLQATIQRHGRLETFSLDVPEPGAASASQSFTLNLETDGSGHGAGIHANPSANVFVELIGSSGGNVELKTTVRDEHNRAALQHRIHELEVHLEHLRQQIEETEED